MEVAFYFDHMEVALYYFDHMEVAFYFDHMEVVRGQFQREILMLPFSQLQNQLRANI